MAATPSTRRSSRLGLSAARDPPPRAAPSSQTSARSGRPTQWVGVAPLAVEPAPGPAGRAPTGLRQGWGRGAVVPGRRAGRGRRRAIGWRCGCRRRCAWSEAGAGAEGLTAADAMGVATPATSSRAAARTCRATEEPEGSSAAADGAHAAASPVPGPPRTVSTAWCNSWRQERALRSDVGGNMCSPGYGCGRTEGGACMETCSPSPSGCPARRAAMRRGPPGRQRPELGVSAKRPGSRLRARRPATPRCRPWCGRGR